MKVTKAITYNAINSRLITLSAAIIVIVFACCLFANFTPSSNFTGYFTVASVRAQSSELNEGFEAGGKSAYAAATITLGSGQWYLSDALIGNTTSDRKTGTLRWSSFSGHNPLAT